MNRTRLVLTEKPFSIIAPAFSFNSAYPLSCVSAGLSGITSRRTTGTNNKEEEEDGLHRNKKFKKCYRA